ncbi:MAG: L-threonylcarbamoyladenylate synthase [Acidobacteriota bacterium]
MLLTIDPEQPEPWLIARVVQTLKRSGIVVVPTDTVYALACAFEGEDGIERLYEVKQIPPAKRLSLMVPDIATASRFIRGIPTPVYRTMRRVLPGPFTFIFEASRDVPRVMLRKRRTVGIRIPDCPIIQAVLEALGVPLMTTSVTTERGTWLLDPIEIEADIGDRVDLVVDGGILANEPSTVIDLTGRQPVIVRQGKGDTSRLDFL